MDKILKIKLLSFVVCVFFCFNTHGQNVCVGKIIYEPVNGSSAVFGLQSGSNSYFLTINSHQIEYNDKLIIEDTEYFIGDNVVITGAVTVKQSVNFWDYLELEIETIEKLSSNQDIQYFLGTYEMQTDCTNPWWIGDNVTLRIVEETDPNAAFDFRLHFSGKVGRAGINSSVLNDKFVIEQWEYYESGNISEYISGEGYEKNDSIFINLKHYDYDQWREDEPSLVLSKDCHCKGKKISSVNVLYSLPDDETKIYFDVTNQLIVLDETLQNQSFTLELVDMQGKVILKKTNVDSSINVANISNGVYLYRLLQNGQAIHYDKILKTN